MKKIKHIVAIAISLFIFCNFGFSQSYSPSSKTISRIEDYLNKLEKVGLSGTILVEQNGQTLISKGYGFSNEKQKLKNSQVTVFDIGSITKQFTAAAILKLEMQGKLSTQNKITEYFDNVPSDKSAITIHDLLRHQTGLPSVVGGDYDKITQAEFIEKVMKTPLRFENGTRFSYSNVGYSLLGMIVEKVSGMNYEEFLYQNLWQPAGMELTGYTRPNFDKSLIPIGYKEDNEWGKPTDKAWDTNAPFWHLKGNGGILSTTGDLYKWHLALLSDKILSNKAKQKYFQPKLREGETLDSYYAYGWDVHKTNRGTTVIQHNGTNNVFYADFQRYVEDKLTIILLSNKSQISLNQAPNAIYKLVFEPNFKPVIPIAENKANRQFTEEIIKITLEKGFDEAIKTYRRRKSELDLIERKVNAKGYDLMNDKNSPKGIEVFRINVTAFPKSANAYDSLGEAYMESGNKILAIENYEKSLKLDPNNQNAREMLERLKK